MKQDLLCDSTKAERERESEREREKEREREREREREYGCCVAFMYIYFKCIYLF